MFSSQTLAVFSGLLATLPSALAGYSATSQNNVAVYWGQNSVNIAGTSGQQRLSYYCANTQHNIINLSFLTVIATPTLNLANAGDNCTAITGSSLFYCSQLEEDIPACQALGKTILLSIGGATYSEGGFSTAAAAVTAATNIWKIFGPVVDTTTPRPFGKAVINGFDFDFESTVTNMAAFGNQLRTSMDAVGTYYLSAAPQCFYPDSADWEMLNGGVSFDFVQIQFYNNPCGVSAYTSGTTNFNMDVWQTWATTISKNKSVRLFLGIPAASSINYYASGTTLSGALTYSKTFANFGGVMVWDMSLLWQNSGFLTQISNDLGPLSGGGSTVTTTAVTSAATTAATKTTSMTTTLVTSTKITSVATTFVTSKKTSATAAATSTTVATGTGAVDQWNQCAGEGWTGGTVCMSPYTCVAISTWYSQCE